MNSKSNIFQEHKSDFGLGWHYYLVANQGRVAKCKKCTKEIKCQGGTAKVAFTPTWKLYIINLKTNSDGTADNENDVSYPS